MIQFLVDNIDQLDLALDQLAVSDRNFDRFAMMLVDNVVELTLHCFVQDKAGENELWGQLGEHKHDPKVIQNALGQNFDNKAKGARKLGLMDGKICESILNLHAFRNTSYHRGLRHEGILHSLAIFYFRLACDLLSEYEPRAWCWSSNDKISYRARKYIGEPLFMNHREDFQSAYARLKEVAESMEFALVADLASDMKFTIEMADSAIDFLSKDSPEPKSRTAVVVDSQAWPYAFTHEGKQFARKNGCKERYVGAYVEWIKENRSWPIGRDPIPRWKRRLKTLAAEKNEHVALKRYCSFMKQTEDIRSKLSESAAQLDAHIQQQIDIARGK